MTYLPWLLSFVAVWLIAAPFLLGYADTTVAMQNDIAVGAVMLIAGFIGVYQALRDRGWGTQAQPERRS
ncbi:MAG: SPW repeat protein [Nitrospirota bacterium]